MGSKNNKSRTQHRQRRRELTTPAKLDARLNRSNGGSRAIMVLGMHRSGTSAFTRMINLLGADLPRNLLAPNETNKAGYWESSDLMVINDQLLSSSGSRWDDWRAFNSDWYGSSTATTFKAKIVDFLRRDFSASALFVIKDPRICRFWPLWYEALSEFGTTPSVIIPVRSPLEVAASLKHRDALTSAKSLLLWLRHVLDAEKATRNVPRAIVTYDALLKDWKTVEAIIASALELKWPRRGAISEFEIEQFVTAQMRHYSFTPEELDARAEVVDWVKDTYELMRRMAAPSDHMAEKARLDQIHSEFDKASVAFGVALAEGEVELAERDQEVSRLSHDIAIIHEQIRETVTVREAKVARLAEELALMKSEVEQGERERQKLRSSVEALQATAANANASASWFAEELAAARATMEDRQHECQRLSATLMEREQALAEKGAAASRLAEDVALLRSAADDRAADDQSRREVQRISRELESTRAFLRESQTQLQSLHGELDTTKDELLEERSKRNVAVQELDKQSSALRAELDDLRQGESRMIGELRRLQFASDRVVLQQETLLDYRSQIDVLTTKVKTQTLALRSSTESEKRIQDALLGMQRLQLPGILPQSLLRTYRERRWLDRLLRSCLFQSSWYVGQYSSRFEAAESAWDHYLRIGRESNLAPNPFLDPRWYLQQNDDVATAKVDPVLHFFLHGAREGRDPSPLFSVRSYLKYYPDVAVSGMNPLIHFLLYGQNEGRLPKPTAHLLSSAEERAHETMPVANYPAHPKPTGDKQWDKSIGGEDRLYAREPAHEPQLSSAGGPRITVEHLKTGKIATSIQRHGAIVCVSHVTPWPRRAGNEYRIGRFLDWLMRRGFNVIVVIAPLDEVIENSTIEAIAERYGTTIVCDRDGRVRYTAPEALPWLEQLQLQPIRDYDQVITYDLAESHQEIRRIERTFCHDVLVQTLHALGFAMEGAVFYVNYIFMSRFIQLIKDRHRSFIDMHDLFSSKSDKVTRFGISDGLVLSPEIEAALLKRAHAIVAIQPQEAEIARQLVPEGMVLVAGVDFDLSEVYSPLPVEPVIVFVGSGNSLNVKGLRDFLRFAWPEIVNHVPGAELRVAGAVGRSIESGIPGVKALGFVDDIGKLYAGARIVINPAVGGTGLKVKTVEALSHRRRIVTWPNGIDGLPLELARLCFVAGDWYEFAQLVIAALRGDCRLDLSDEDVADLRANLSGDVVYADVKRWLEETA